MNYPTKEHEVAANKVVEIFSKDKRVMDILISGSCARSIASKDSDLDIFIMVKNNKTISGIEKHFQDNYENLKEFGALKKVGKYSEIDLHFSDGIVKPVERSWTSGPDGYELAIGNIFAYSIVLFDRNGYFGKMKKRYMPYYSESLRKRRLKEVKMYLFNNLDHVPLYIKRGLYFQSFSRLYNASKEFLQALFIKNRTYPIAYDKWVKEQLVEILNMPRVYKEFVRLYEINNLESTEIMGKAGKLRAMSRKYL